MPIDAMFLLLLAALALALIVANWPTGAEPASPRRKVGVVAAAAAVLLLMAFIVWLDWSDPAQSPHALWVY